jgi:hypothetical protein
MRRVIRFGRRQNDGCGAKSDASFECDDVARRKHDQYDSKERFCGNQNVNPNLSVV